MARTDPSAGAGPAGQASPVSIAGSVAAITGMVAMTVAAWAAVGYQFATLLLGSALPWVAPTGAWLMY